MAHPQLSTTVLIDSYSQIMDRSISVDDENEDLSFKSTMTDENDHNGQDLPGGPRVKISMSNDEGTTLEVPQIHTGNDVSNNSSIAVSLFSNMSAPLTHFSLRTHRISVLRLT